MSQSKIGLRPYHSRSNAAITLVEVLISALVIGIAIAGMTELIWLNATWSTKSYNKIDNYFAAQTFTEKISRDVRMAVAVSTPSNGNYAVANAVDEIDIVVPKSNFDQNGFPMLQNPNNPLGPETVKYVVVPDPNNAGQYQIWYYSSQYEALGSWVVLSGLIGPTLPQTTTPRIFEYVAKNTVSGDPTTGIQQPAPYDVGAVIINLELRRQTFGLSNATELSPTSPSVFGVRTEITLRNVPNT